MATVREAGHPMLMPAVKHDNIKDEIKKFDAGELDAISERAISSGDRSESFRLIILRRQKPERSMSAEHRALLKLHEKQVRVEDKYYVFATTLPDSLINGDPKNVAELYKMRWGIEKLLQVMRQVVRAAAAVDHQQQTLRTHSVVVYTVHTVQPVVAGTFPRPPNEPVWQAAARR